MKAATTIQTLFDQFCHREIQTKVGSPSIRIVLIIFQESSICSIFNENDMYWIYDANLMQIVGLQICLILLLEWIYAK